ncbi:hypothetical protein GCM10008013_22880 [Paenibacillus segetis]|uniref:Uncharacterized protein n=1 Tax=Paenibacillus segetis TaxID=1325360 RepID=A0ABQ1YGJ5_9BACL|nr:hypothetical protein GCM10008013_22880 [Paenibacillus segetis]
MNASEWNLDRDYTVLFRWIKTMEYVFTPERLHNNLSRVIIDPPNDIERVLRVFDEEEKLIEASMAYPE